MERRFDLRLEELLEGAVLDPRIPEGMLDRLEQFVKPFAASLANGPQRQHVWEYMAGLFSDVKRKSAETIAYFHDQDRQALQKFVGQSLWDDRPPIGELARQIGTELGEANGVLVFDPSAFEKQGKESVGVAGSGVAVWEKSTIAKWVCIWGTSRARSTPWWTRGCI